MEETIPIAPWRVGLKMFMFVEGIALGFFAAGASIAALVEGKAEEIPITFGLFAVLGLMVAVPWGIGAWMMYRQGRSTLSVHDGTVTARHGNISFKRYPLSDCQWFSGTTTQSGNFALPSRPAILIAVPDRTQRHQEFIVPVGFDDQSRQRWEAFLTLADIPRRSLWEKRRSWFLRAAVVIAGLAMLMAAVVGSLSLAFRVIPAALVEQGVPQDVAEAIGWPLFMPGCVFAILYLLVFWPWQLIPRVSSTKPITEQARVRRRGIWATLIFGMLLCGLPMMPGRSGERSPDAWRLAK